MKPGKDHNQSPFRGRTIESLAIVAFIGVNLFAPLVTGEMYPFTISPMFSDQPGSYATYEVSDADGGELPLQQFNLHLVYDGNPPGLGMGIVPQPTVHEFGEIGTRQQIVQHVREVMQREEISGPVRVTQTVVRPDGHRLATRSETWTVESNNE